MGRDWFTDLLLRLAVVLVFAAGVAVALIFFVPEANKVQCDGAVPTWMIDAQDPPYNGRGCAQVLPTDEAPPGADWSPYCLGLCDLEQFASQEPRQ